MTIFATDRRRNLTVQAPHPSRSQRVAAREITAWYLNRYYQTASDVGVAAMFCRQDLVGHFAVSDAALASGDGDALFRLLVTVTMFQRRSDQQIMRVLRGISREDAVEMTNPGELLRLVDDVDCPHVGDLVSLKDRCDLAKHPETKRGICRERPEVACHLKRHTELLKRYGHFGKVPTSAALSVRSHGAQSLADIKATVWSKVKSPEDRAVAIEAAITRSWRVSEKIAAMFLSAVTNRDLSGALAPWADGVDTSYFVVVDSNVDLFLQSVGYPGPWTYRARREFVQELARRVPLDKLRPGLTSYNPRVVQQALYMFMSESNRRSSASDCSHEGPASCAACPAALSQRCPRRVGDNQARGGADV